ncbi:MAG: phosphoenolpyruvate carboxykinase (ATP) [Armatimonadetes bacterium]|nr:phosphoenolpyruvate carboxykinase (ATP) [Armatimonadota bacterium]MBS1712517.1 phosphoenolpyruvate carboxykinase (ATP) [Armatimonadota bacterium]MBX3109174.1 phosphoenolpyruvate carboxykinase (ATP) [Fimbriimonadaceae bacterium]
MTQTRFDLSSAAKVYWNLSPAELVEQAIRNGEGELAANGALVARTGKYTGRTPKDKCVVKDSETADKVWWENNADISPEQFEYLANKAQKSFAGKTLYVVDTYGGADPANRIKARFIVEKAWHALFIRTLLIRPSVEELAAYEPDWTVVDMCMETCDPATDNTKGDAVIALNFSSHEVVVMGTQYAGEMKKSVFTILNYILPLKGVLSMHCSANIGPDGDTALFFGLSGTGKTTLSADPGRALIGDDEHGWSDTGVFNFEGGCYAKCINLSREGEPQIWNAIRFQGVLENVVLGDRRIPDYTDTTYTENTRCAYPLENVEGSVIPSVGGHPQNVVFLTADAFGVLPPIARLTPEQTMFFFLNGYTAKVAGTEAGVTEPQATFSSCFGAPFLPLPPKVYAEMLKAKIEKHGARVWLVNTGWTGGPYGVGNRMKLSHTRAMITAALSGGLDAMEFVTDPVFGLHIPTGCPGVPSEVLAPRETWADKAAYDSKANELKAMFDANYAKFTV